MSAKWSKGLLTSSAAWVLAAGGAFAQPVTDDPTTVDEIVVTGSRIATLAVNSPQPVEVVTAQTIAAMGQTQVVDVLDRLPALLASSSSAQADGAATTLNLRGMGSNRTLVLVNGRRHVAGVAGSAAVDVSSIPSGLVERVEVLTGGASAVYGSDAVTGVVNYILRNDFEGTEVDFQAGISERGDGLETYVSILHGRNFANGRGNVTFSVQANERDAVFYGDRSWSRDNQLGDGDYDNPALYFQAGDPVPPGFTFQDVMAERIVDSNGNPRFPGTDSSLVDRARNAPPFAYVSDPRFSLSSTDGLIGFDLDGDGYAEGAAWFPFGTTAVADACGQSFNGMWGLGCLIIDRTTGQLRPFQDGIYQGQSNQSGGDGAAQTFNGQSMLPKDSAYSINLTGNYELNNNLRAFLEAKVSYNRGVTYSPYNTYDDSIPISLDNPFIPAEVRALIDAEIAANPAYANTAQLTIARDHTDIVDPRAEQERWSYRTVIGLEGTLPDLGWNFEVSANYGRTTIDTTFGARLEDRWFAALDAVTDPATGEAVCRSTLDPTAVPPISGLYPDFPGPIPNPFSTFTPGAGSDCRPLNVFSYGAPSDEAAAFVAPLVTNSAEIDQFVLSGFLTGDTEQWFSLPGGPVDFVVGGEYRRESSDFVPNDYSRDGQVFRYANTAPVSGSFNVAEVYGELNLPLLANLPFAETLNLSLAYRASDYSTVGSASTWKASLIWAPVSDLRLRGGYASTVRAPNISELYAPLQTQGMRPNDPCHANLIGLGSSTREANCRAALAAVGVTVGTPYDFTNTLSAQFFGAAGGNPDLREETSKSYTAGFVLTPRFLPGFTATVDYWNIEIEDAIASVTDQDIVNNCYDAASLDNQYCALIRRNPTTGPQQGVFTYIERRLLNFAGLEASGVDFAVNYRFDLDSFGAPAWGSMNFGVQGTYLEDRNNFPFPTEPDRPNPQKLETNFPEWALNTTVQWSRDDWTVSLFSHYQTRQTRFRTEIEDVDQYANPWNGEIWTHDASVQYSGFDRTRITFGVNNLTDEIPFYGLVATPVSGMGRYYFLRFSKTL